MGAIARVVQWGVFWSNFPATVATSRESIVPFALVIAGHRARIGGEAALGYRAAYGALSEQPRASKSRTLWRFFKYRELSQFGQQRWNLPCNHESTPLATSERGTASCQACQNSG